MKVNNYTAFQTLSFKDGYQLFIHGVNGYSVDAVLYTPNQSDYVEYEDVDCSVIDALKSVHNGG